MIGKRKVIVLTLAIAILAVSFAGWKHSTITLQGRKCQAYVVLMGEDGYFELADFNISLGNVSITPFNVNTPFLLTSDTCNVTVSGTAVGWSGVRFNIMGSLHLQPRTVTFLKLHHYPSRFVVLEGERIPLSSLPRTFFANHSKLKEEIIGTYGDDMIKDFLRKNKVLREKYLNLWLKTGNLTYLQAYRDLSYHLDMLVFLYRLGKLDEKSFRYISLGLIATTYYYETFQRPGHKDMSMVFSNWSPYYGTIKIVDGPINLTLPFVYYRARGFNLYPVSAVHWAEESWRKGKINVMLSILNDIIPFIREGEYHGVKYTYLPVYFHFQNSSIPWVSGYSQGVACGMYAIAYNVTKDEQYLRLATLFFNSFKVPVDYGGFVIESEFGPWILEYPYYPTQLVLNGHIISARGLYYYYEVTGDREALKLFLTYVESVKRALPYFDTGNWSRYAIIYNSSSVFYHRLHIRLLYWLYRVTGDETFLEYAKKWNEYLVKRGLKPENLV
ncbi:D-glucuronyl C5-epimerase family protein [Pyrococcus kukulkanii]|uniref:D-glucuronyl C5-epimerase family protein n=1 Tax=Pyrococcus kukulkanii TaxID=1609559 RepID=A0ABV4T4B4_9EURY